MATIIIKRTVNLDGPIMPESLGAPLYQSENQAHRFEIECTRGGAPIALAGTVQARMIRPDGNTVAITGSISGGKAVLVLPQAAYAYQGRFALAIINVASGVTTVLYAAMGDIRGTTTGSTIDPGSVVPDLTQLLAEIGEMRAATAAANTAAARTLENFAPPFDANTPYSAGEYVTYTDGKLYQFTADHAAGMWNAGDVVQTQLSRPIVENAEGIDTLTDLMVRKPEMSDPSYPYGTSGQVLRTNGDGTTSWVDVGLPTDEQTAGAIEAWMDAHPEASTTIADHSITSEKLNGRIPFYNVQDYGVMPSPEENPVDVYDALQALISERVYHTGGIVFFPAGRYVISYTIFIPEGTTFLGVGEKSEIHFDETDTTFGVGLANAGSYVTIKNLKVSQASDGPFVSGAQPGCIGFSDLAKENALIGRNHTSGSYVRAAAHDLTAENITFEGKYPIQTENTTNNEIYNVNYRNLYSEIGCVSVMSHQIIRNVILENITCDLLRLSIDGSGQAIKNIISRNIRCNKFIIVNPYDDGYMCFDNFRQTTNIRHSPYGFTGYSGAINANVHFTNSVFNAKDDETGGIILYNGVRKYTNCIFNAPSLFFSREVTIAQSSTDNYEVMEGCEFNGNGSAPSVILGYGHNNKFNATNITNLLWGDMHSSFMGQTFTGIADGSQTFHNQILVDGDRIHFMALGLISKRTGMFQIPQSILLLPLYGDNIPVLIWNQASGNYYPTYAYINSLREVYAPYPSVYDDDGYDMVMINTILPLSRKPTPYEVVRAFLLGVE